MKIKELIYQTPEMTEEKLLMIIDTNLFYIKEDLKNRVKELHKKIELNKAFLEEYDLIQDKKSLLTKSQRDSIIGFVGLCMIKMTKDDGTGNSESESESRD